MIVRLLTAFIGLWVISGNAQVSPGIDTLSRDGYRALRGKRIGLITNPSGVNRQKVATVDLLQTAEGIRVRALFAPEHGVRGDVKAGERITGKPDPRTGLPVHSLYGATRKPTPDMLRGLDALVYDLQDTGVRSYTFISTMGLAMEACAEAGIEFIVLDRPNPLGGMRIEGPGLDSRFRSFVGQWNIPYVYGQTAGELARMINGEGWIAKPCKLTVVPLQGWNRSMVWKDTGLPWVPSSPNIPAAESPMFYASTGLFGEIAGGSGINIGTRFRRPFEWVVAPWLDGEKLAREMNRKELGGVRFEPLSVAQDGRQFGGVRLRFTDPHRATLVAINFHLLDAVRVCSGRDLFREAVRHGKGFEMFDKVCGTDSIRKALQAGQPAGSIASAWTTGEKEFRRMRSRYLLYPEGGSTPIAAAAGAKPTASRAIAADRWITIVKGDTAIKIARDFGLSVSDLSQSNPGLDMQRLKPGQKLKVPGRPPA